MKNTLPTGISKICTGVAIALGLLSTSASANTLQGELTDAQNKARFEGAKVIIKELGREVSSERNGEFRFINLPAGTYTLEVRYIGAQSVTQQVVIKDQEVTQTRVVLSAYQGEMDNIIVKGQRAGQAGALNRQKNADGIKSIVSADSIGQLPDQNAAEALQRLPGLFIERDQGEGRFVGIRGIDPNLNNVTINGAAVPSPEGGVRSVAMDVLPSEIIQSLEVSKTVTPDMDANAIGGSIEVKSLSAFDREGESYSFNVQGAYNEQVEKSSPKLSASYSDIYEISSQTQLGVATAVSWFERKFGSHNMETDGGWMELEMEDANTGEEVTFFGAEEIEQRLYTITRERLGAALNLDLHQGLFNKYYLRTMYSEFSDNEFRLRNEYKFDKGEYLSDQSGDTMAYFSGTEMDRDSKDRYEEQSILSVVAGGEHLVSDWFIEYSLVYSKSDEQEPDRLDMAFAAEDLTLGYASLGDTPTLSRSEGAHQLNGFELDEIVHENNLSEDEATSFKLDLTKDLVISGHNAELKFGVKYRDREKFNSVNAVVYDGGFDDVTAEQFKAVAPEYDLGDFGPGLSEQALQSYFANNKSAFERNDQETSIESKGRSYRSEETVSALYAMVNIDFGKLNLITGVRYEDTDYTTRGYRVALEKDKLTDSEQVNISPWEVDKSYDHLMPNLTLRYELADDVISRFAYTQTIARPGFEEAAAYQLLESETDEDDGQVVTEREGEVGNPELDPYESHNLDLSVEYYTGSIGVMSAGLFYKQIDNFITEQEVQDQAQWAGYKKVMQYVNGGEADLTGIELAYSKNFKNGLMFSANTTLIDADDKLTRQSDTVANLMVGYEDDSVSARLSGNYKSKAYLSTENDARVYQDDHMQLDLSVKYYFTEQMQVYFNAINLTDEPLYIYHGEQKYNFQYEQYGRSFELGFTYTSF
ncbi:TonB-dependent receptor [Pseudoalteromonas rubra]|uniref:TonB-dependent receptor n=2 Tax=Pseudoalteromonas TaxID=53246 RepID=A0A5S3WY12_9GAMM|nr:TonB-dependent receptor [Pseudoalteromonas rubra]TMP35965.1 TonB-dependent receptor [Pseudoalteromonas rubra]